MWGFFYEKKIKNTRGISSEFQSSEQKIFQGLVCALITAQRQMA